MPSSAWKKRRRSEEHTSELQSHDNLVCRLFREKNKPASLPAPPIAGRLRQPRLGTDPRAGAGGHGLLWTLPSPPVARRVRELGCFFFLMKRRPPSSRPFPFTAPVR